MHAHVKPLLTTQETPKVTTKRVSSAGLAAKSGHERSLANFYLQTLHITPSRWMRKTAAGAASHRGSPILSRGNELTGLSWLGSFEQ